MNGFVGQYEHQMDPKGRVSLPSAFRHEAESERFVLLQWESPYLTLFPENKWLQVQEKLLDLRRRDAKAWHPVRLMIAQAVDVSPDKQGRILVPAHLQEKGGLSGAVLLSGNIDRIELWDPETYYRTVKIEADDLADFAHELFG